MLGAGAVGVEFASFWRSAGSEVTLVEMAPRLVPLEDEAIGRELRKQFEGARDPLPRGHDARPVDAWSATRAASP